MDAHQIRRLKPELTRFLNRFGDCFARRDTRARFPVYIQGKKRGRSFFCRSAVNELRPLSTTRTTRPCAQASSWVAASRG